MEAVAHSTKSSPSTLTAATLRRFLTGCLILASIAWMLIWPGDVPVHDDERGLLSLALEANQAHRLADTGLSGTYGYGYGPLPTQFYQLLLTLTHDLSIVVTLRTAFCAGLLLAALLSISHTLRLPAAFIAVVIGSPWVELYCRKPWDNTFCIPIGTVALAAYARWLEKPDKRAAMIWAGGCVMLPLIHLSAVVLPATLLVHSAFRRRSAFRHSLGWITLAGIVACSTSIPYIRTTAQAMVQQTAVSVGNAIFTKQTSTDDGYASGMKPPSLASARQVFSAGVILTGEQRFVSFEDSPGQRAISALVWFTLAAHIWMVSGLLLAGRQFIRAKASSTVGQTLLRLSFLMVLLQSFVFGLLRVPWQEHYFGPIFPATVLLCWWGIQFFHRSTIPGG